MKTILFIIGLSFAYSAPTLADSFPGCTDWERERGSSDQFLGRTCHKFTRDCSELKENPKYEKWQKFLCHGKLGKNKQIGSDRCLKMKVCMPKIQGSPSHPGQLEGDCTRWFMDRGTTCAPLKGESLNGIVWRRKCVMTGIQVPESACAPRSVRRSSGVTKEYWLIY